MINESQFESASSGRRAMDISVNQCNDETFELVFDETAIPISIGDMEQLHYQLSKILRPTTVQEKKARHQAFLAKLKFAEDSGIQALMRRASHDDILVLLRASERDVALKKKLYSNMSENSIKIYVEDLVFQFRQGLPDYRLDEAMTRLLKTAENLAKDGTLSFKRT